MKTITFLLFFLLAVSVGPRVGRAQCMAGSAFSGRATVVNATVLGLPVVLVDTGPLPGSGGSLGASQQSLNPPGVLTAGIASASTDGSGSLSQSQASVATVNLGVGGVTLTADLVSSTAAASCGSGGPAVGAASQVANLVINGFADRGIRHAQSDHHAPSGSRAGGHQRADQLGRREHG